MRVSKSELRAIVESWTEAGLPAKHVAPLAQALERVEAIDRDAAELQSLDTTTAIVEAVAAGEISFAEGVSRHGLKSQAMQPASTSNHTTIGSVIQDGARAAVLRTADNFLRMSGYKLHDIVDKRIHDVHGSMAKLEVELQGIDSADQAADAGDAAALAWGQRQRAHHEYTALQTAAGLIWRKVQGQGAA